jgi:hypothetical protein
MGDLIELCKMGRGMVIGGIIKGPLRGRTPIRGIAENRAQECDMQCHDTYLVLVLVSLGKCVLPMILSTIE